MGRIYCSLFMVIFALSTNILSQKLSSTIHIKPKNRVCFGAANIHRCEVAYFDGLRLRNATLECTLERSTSKEDFVLVDVEKVWKTEEGKLYADHIQLDIECLGIVEELIVQESDMCSKHWCTHSADNHYLQESGVSSKSDLQLDGIREGKPNFHHRLKRDTHQIDTVLTEPKGTITSDGYPFPYPSIVDQDWTIIAPEHTRFVIQLEYLNITQCYDVSGDAYCCDELTIHANEPLHFCGVGSVFEPIHPNAGHVAIHFTANDTSKSGTGFRLSYTTLPTLFTDLSGEVSSPNYDSVRFNTYPNLLNLTWTVHVSSAYHLKIWFDTPFELEGYPGFCVDRLQIGSGLQVDLIAAERDLCGLRPSDRWIEYYTLTNRVWFNLVSDERSRWRGFKLYYQAVQRVFTDDAGVITSPDFPNSYGENVYTKYYIQAPEGYVIELTFKELEIPGLVFKDLKSSEFTQGWAKHENCHSDSDWLKVRSGHGILAEHFTRFGRADDSLSRLYCNGVPYAERLLSVENNLVLTLNSDSTKGIMQRFTIHYRFIRHVVELPSFHYMSIHSHEVRSDTLGYLLYPIRIPAGHDLEVVYSNINEVDCTNEYMQMMYIDSGINPTVEGLICSRSDTAPTSRDILYLQPTELQWSTPWSLYLIVGTPKVEHVYDIALRARPTYLDQAEGIMWMNLPSVKIWASCRDTNLPISQTLRVKAPTCSRLRYFNLGPDSNGVPCDNRTGLVVSSLYLNPSGKDRKMCGNFLDYVEGNEVIFTWYPPLLPQEFPLYGLIVYASQGLEGDCSFEMDLCKWIELPSSYAPVSWTRTSTELHAQFVDYFRYTGAENLDTARLIWQDHHDNSQDALLFSGYYLHVPMDRHYAGEKAHIATPLFSSDTRRSLSFKYHMHGKEVGHLNVYTWEPESDLYSLIWSNHGEIALTWQYVEGIAASACSDYHIVFEATIPEGQTGGAPSDIAIDDVYFCQLPVVTANREVCNRQGYILDIEPNTWNNGAARKCCCDEGYTGLACTQHVNLCETMVHQCENGGTCLTWQYDREDLVPAVCECVAGWTGTYCEEEVNECLPNPCLNGARCVARFAGFHCLCPSYFYGDYCENSYDVCTQMRPCLNGAECINVGDRGYRCRCAPGYTGGNCAVEMNECYSSPCINGATCYDEINEFTCTCPPGYSGILCEKNHNDCLRAVTEGWCRNGARCTDTVNGFRCKCTEGWTGRYCDEQVNECLTDPCIHGTCIDRFRNFLCVCDRGYQGKRCERKIDFCVENRCEQGFCRNLDTGYRCDCLDGYGGDFCQIHINDCISMPCASGATCRPTDNAFYCQCPVGSTGPLCLEKVDYCSLSDPCLHSSSCISTDAGFICSCSPGFRGQLCELQASGCQGHPCKYGLCVDESVGDYRCSCIEGWSGANCDIPAWDDVCLAQPCRSGSTCVHTFNGFLCVCSPGFTGVTCNDELDECLSEPCLNGASCSDLVNGFKCDCLPGWEGDLCVRPTNLCASLHCIHGVCKVVADCKPRCVCERGFQGDYCERVADNCLSHPCASPSVCLNLVDDFYCKCDPSLPLMGPTCSDPIPSCSSAPCRNGGTCHPDGFTYHCECPEYTWGGRCEQIVRPCDRNPCVHGTCTNVDEVAYRCNCETGWALPRCDVLADPCSTYPCSPGTCVVLSNGDPFCLCPGGASGLRCQLGSDACSGRTCYNGGYCEVGTEDVLESIPVCVCPPNYAGYSCEVDLNTGAIIGGLNRRRRAANVNPDLQEDVTCHPLGNDTSPSTKWLIGAIIASIYVIILWAAIAFTVIQVRLHKSYVAPAYQESGLDNYRPKGGRRPEMYDRNFRPESLYDRAHGWQSNFHRDHNWSVETN